MKKLLSGILIGIFLSTATVVNASNVIEATLYPVKLFLNGSQKDLKEEYQILNLNGHAYVPIRFVVEEMNGKVTFDDTANSINVTFPSLETVPLNNYKSEDAIRNGDIVVKPSQQIINGNKVKTFYEHYKQGQHDWIRIAEYTIEGDPIIREFLYDGNALWYLFDNVRDKFGSQVRVVDQCQNFEFTEATDEYIISGCPKLDKYVIQVQNQGS